MKSVLFTVTLGMFSAFNMNAVQPAFDNHTTPCDFDKTPRFRRNHQPKVSRDHSARTMLIRQLLLDRYDLDGNGLINGEERDRLFRDAKKARDEAMYALIKRFDLDGDGKLNTEEYDELLKHIRHQRRGDMNHPQPSKTPPRSVHCPMPPERNGPMALLISKLILEKYDADDNGSLDENESKNLMADAKKLFDERRQELLARFDANRDGKLDPQEAETARHTLREEREIEAAFPEHDPIDMYLNTYYDMDVIRSLDVPPRR